MKLILEICHASEYASDGWKMIQPVSSKEEFFDHLESPSFDVCLSLLCRLRNKRTNKIIEMYAFNGGEFVDIGTKSEIISKQYDVDFAVAWHTENHPVPLCRLVEQHLPQDACLRLCVAMMEKIPYIKHEFVAWIKAGNFDDSTYQSYESRFRETLSLRIPRNDHYALLSAQLVLCLIKDFDDSVNVMSNFCFYASSVIAGETLSSIIEVPEVATMIRTVLPFHEVIAWVTQE